MGTQTENLLESGRIIQSLLRQGYFDIRWIDGICVGLYDYITTRAIVVGLTDLSYERRYCYPTRSEATVAINKWTDTTVHPSGNWIKLKGRFQGKPVDMLNPNWNETNWSTE